MATPIVSKTARDKLPPRREPYFARVQSGLYVGFRKLAEGDGTWIARRRNEAGKQEYKALGTLPSFDDAVKATLEWSKAADAVDVRTELTHWGCGYFLGLIYVANPRLSRYSMGLR
ncbi:hypothetical protein [Burkholderia cenocepacia]|nr:hypothetical protein [Burkholderia cenocepacia]